MNKLFIKILAGSSVFLFLFGFTNPRKEFKGEVKIKDVRKAQEPKPDLALHKPYDVEVYRVIFMEEAYKVTYYQKENDSLKSHGAIYGSKDDYDKAAYHWLNDTMVSIRLFNTNSHKEVTFKVYGYGARNGMITDK